MAWKEFRCGKRNKPDIQEFEFHLEDNLFQLHQELKNKTYQHSNYTSFYVSDPKLRHIRKACVRDMVLHHAVFRILYQTFDKSFIFDSYSCRLNKGTHRAVNRLEKFYCKLSRNNTRNIFALKCDVRKFFNSIDQVILLALIERKIKDKNAIWLIEKIIRSFENNRGRGLPLGNVTSQLFANIYLYELDQFIKHKLKIKYYLRYCDDFVILAGNKNYFMSFIEEVEKFLEHRLKLFLNPGKIIIRKYHHGIDFLGYVVLPYYRVLRTKTKRRILKKIKVNRQKLPDRLLLEEFFNQSLQSCLGVLKHCRGYKIKKKVVF